MSVSHYLAMLPEGRNASFPSSGFAGWLPISSFFADFCVVGKMREMTDGQRSVSWPC